MKPWLQVVFSVSVCGLLTAVNGLAGSGDSSGAGSTREQQMGRPLAEMMLYEAAEQAVEDGYARIVPESDVVTPEEDVTETVDETTPAVPAPSSLEGKHVEE